MGVVTGEEMDARCPPGPGRRCLVGMGGGPVSSALGVRAYRKGGGKVEGWYHISHSQE